MRATPNGIPAAIMLAFLTTAGLTYVNVMPALVDGLETALGYSTKQAGIVAGTNIYGAAAGALAAALLVRRIRWRPVAAALLATLMAFDALSCFVQAFLPLVVLRGLDGLAGGFLIGTGFAVIARSGQADRVFGMLLLVQFGFSGLGNMVMPKLVGSLGMPVVFGTLLAFSAITAVMLRFLPPYPAAPRPPGHAARARLPWGLLTAVFLFQFANMGLAAHIIALGVHAGLARGAASTILGVASWIGITGSLLVILLPPRIGRARPLLAGYILNCASIWVFLFAANPSLFAAGNTASSITWTLVIPYLFGLVSAADPTGEAASYASFASKLGLATGPLAAGWLIAGGDFRPLIAVSAVAMTASALIALRLAWRAERPTPSPAPMTP